MHLDAYDSGVARLLLVDALEIIAADLSFMQFEAQDVGKRKIEQLAHSLHHLSPDVRVHASGLALDKMLDIVNALRAATAKRRRRTAKHVDRATNTTRDRASRATIVMTVAVILALLATQRTSVAT